MSFIKTLAFVTAFSAIPCLALAQQDSVRGGPRWRTATPLTNQAYSPGASIVEPMSAWFSRNAGKSVTFAFVGYSNGPYARAVADELPFAQLFGVRADMWVANVSVSTTGFSVSTKVHQYGAGILASPSNPYDSIHLALWNASGWRENFSVSVAQLEGLGGAGVLQRDASSTTLGWKLVGIPFFANALACTIDANGNCASLFAAGPVLLRGAPALSAAPYNSTIDAMAFDNQAASSSYATCWSPATGRNDGPCFSGAVSYAAALGIPSSRVLVFDHLKYTPSAGDASGLGGSPD